MFCPETDRAIDLSILNQFTPKYNSELSLRTKFASIKILQ